MRLQQERRSRAGNDRAAEKKEEIAGNEGEIRVV